MKKAIMVFLMLLLLAKAVCASDVTDIKMVFVKGGCYMMGDTFEAGFPAERPAHEVCVSSFYMGRYEVTQHQWNSIMENNPSSFTNDGSNPVEQVTFEQVKAFINKLNSKTGKKYRLPTEAEWEYACRGGGKQKKYSGSGNNADDYAWYWDNSKTGTHPVGQKKQNGIGLFDMSGNVWEWVEDIYAGDAYKNHSRNNPIYTKDFGTHVIRGGGWGSGKQDIRCSSRNTHKESNYFVGFRLARDK
ncbi:MAG: formylglycine-generating enzyme family protein [Nitrospirae bacterium]|nr:formylglycine-generating enzyme family protein [Nitrospirota bacterium]